MKTLLSKDATPIGYETAGTGHPIVFVPGAFNDHTTCAGLAAALSDTYTVITYDRRGRGASGDTPPYAIDREIDDLAGLIDAAGGSAAVFGFSSGALLALQAAVAGLPITALVLFEPPFAVPGRRVPADLAARMQSAVDDERPGDAVALFQTDAVGMKPWVTPELEAIAQSAVYDVLITAALGDPTPGMRALDLPVLVLHGAQTWPQLAAAAALITQAVPGARCEAVAGGEHHGIPVATTAAALRAFLNR